jgi:hypothetical protein
MTLTERLPATTASKPKATSAAVEPEPLAADILIGAQAIADEIGVPLSRCFYWLQTRALPATKTGGTWTTTRSRLRRHFGGPE